MWSTIGRFFPFAVVAVVIVSGCANHASTSAKEENANSSRFKRGQKISSYKVRTTYLRLGETSSRASGEVGAVNFDLEKNAILWNEDVLEFVKKRKGHTSPIFFNPLRHQFIEILGSSGTVDGDAAIIRLESVMNSEPYIQLCRTKNGTSENFFADIQRLKFPEGYYGLIATTKYIDGTAVRIDYKFAASVQLFSKQLLLNNKAANFRRSTLENGNGVILIENEEGVLVVWPDGNWLFSSSRNSIEKYGGIEESLNDIYVTLRQQVP